MKMDIMEAAEKYRKEILTELERNPIYRVDATIASNAHYNGFIKGAGEMLSDVLDDVLAYEHKIRELQKKCRLLWVALAVETVTIILTVLL